MTPKKLPVVDLITATDSACRNLNSSDANELRAKVVNTIGKHGNINDQNITEKERKAIEDLRKDENIMILPADEGRNTVVMDKQEYLDKCNSMLQDTKTYKKLKHDPTAKYKREVAALLKELKAERLSPTPFTRGCILLVINRPGSTACPRLTRSTRHCVLLSRGRKNMNIGVGVAMEYEYEYEVFRREY